jgi:hypothetical protein
MPPPKQQFDAEFIERRLREHKHWQRTKAAEMAVEILEEIVPTIALRLHRVKDSRLQLRENLKKEVAETFANRGRR